MRSAADGHGVYIFPIRTVEYFKSLAVSSAYEKLRLLREKEWSVQRGSSSPALSHAEGKAAATWMGGAYGGVREHGQRATCLRACASKRFSA